ncbi:MAG TPA: hypothetical protein VKV79_08100, partial [Terriglobia bacterium]|nr:hypothetical protein [Terriglobia bacterium]
MNHTEKAAQGDDTHRTPIPFDSPGRSAVAFQEAASLPFTPREPVDLRSAALLEVAQWTPAPPEFDGLAILKERWLRALRSIRSVEKWIRTLASRGVRPAREVQPIALHAAKLHAAFRESQEGLHGQSARKLPLVQRGEHEVVPRIYALVRGFLKASRFVFEERSLLIYLDAAQDESPLDADE